MPPLRGFVRSLHFLIIASALACQGDNLPLGPAAGTLEITTSTTGAEPDPDGYTVQMDDQPAQVIGAAATVRSTEMTAGNHTVRLAGVAGHCSVAGENPRSVSIAAGETTTVSFEVTCLPTTGSLQVSSSTSGASPDADGYTVTIDGTERGTVGTNGELGVEGLALGIHVVGLTRTAANCTVEGANPRSVTVTAAAEAAVKFRIICSGPLVSRIAFSSDRDAPSEKRGIYVMNADGSGAVRLTDGPLDMSPAWSPDGGKIAFMRDFEIYVMNVDGSGQTNLTNNGGGGEWPAVSDGSPAWSPDGSKIAFGTYRDQPGGSTIFAMNADGTGVTRLTTGPADDYTPDWSPDGRKIAFARRERQEGGRSGIAVMNADGTGQRYLSNNGWDLEPDWAPDGSRIVFSSNRHTPGDNSAPEIYVMNADGSGITRLTYNNVGDYSPAWSSDGSKIAFTTTGDGETEVYIMNADGSGQTNLTNNPLAYDSEPNWSSR